MAHELPEGRIRRILVALDASRHSAAALDAAAALAAPLQAELIGLFVEEETVIRAADHPWAHEVQRFPAALAPSSSQAVERQLQARARGVKGRLQSIAVRLGVAWSFEVVRGDVQAHLLAMSREVDLITLGRLGHSMYRRRVGSTTQAVLQQAACPVMILQHGVLLPSSVVVLYDDSEAAEEALDVAVQIARHTPARTLTVLLRAGGTQAEQEGEARVRAVLQPYRVRAVFHPLLRLSFLEVVSRIQMGRQSVLVAPRSLLRDDPGRLDLLLASMTCPLILVGKRF